MAPRPTPRPWRPETPQIEALKRDLDAALHSNFRIIGPSSRALHSIVLWRTDEPPFDFEAPEPMFPLHKLTFA